MFASLNDRRGRSRVRSLGASLLVHGLLLAWLLHEPAARVLAPSSVAAGEFGTVLTPIYFPTQSSQANEDAASPRQHKLIWHKRPKPRKPAPAHETPAPADETQPANAANSPAPGGMPYGTAAGGALSGDEIRPALPIAAIDPVVDPQDLAGRGEGSVIVEVTIDDRGNIVQKVVLQSLGPLIDNKVLAALESWRFRPATRNGVAIPSKQDVYYHFKPAG